MNIEKLNRQLLSDNLSFSLKCPWCLKIITAQNFSEEKLAVVYLQNYFTSQEKQYKEKLLAEMQEVIENSPLVIQLREENNALKSFIEGYKLGKEFVKPTQKGQEFEDFVHEKLQEIFSGNDIVENVTHARTSAGTRADILQIVRGGNELEKVVGKIIYEAKNTERWENKDFGVRLFNVPEDPQSKKTLAEKRREFRGKRRLLNRRYCRKEDLKKFFGEIFGNDLLQEFKNFTEKKKTTNLLKYDETKFFNPYVVRCKALNEKIELVELLFILLHIDKNRGYRDFWENLDGNPEEKDKDDKETKTAVQATKKLFEENNYKSVAEMIVKNEKFRHSRYQNLLSPHNHKPEKIKCSNCRKEVKESETKLIKENFSNLALAYCKVCVDKNCKDKIEAKKDYKHFIFSRKFLEEETQKILEKQSEIECYSQFKRKFPYTLRENGKTEIKELSAQEIIKKIIFRQRDFEDGPGPQDKEKRNLRKEKLDDLLKKHSLDFFENCSAIDNLQKYNKERSPASVSFRYMVETIRAFLDGQKYGEFQAGFKKKIEKDLKNKIVGTSNKNEKMWSP
ncbi:2667_t:CDS:2 [Funneliformis geosporum]|uniref:2667_t:CDS:1 n=1 Tax=Funneliformis geosporum TaxID=1117311 RepID=A0A9W4SDY4_9GLOM|nr:2667_t:CDS:2 [Funneliformis geosporum]